MEYLLWYVRVIIIRKIKHIYFNPKVVFEIVKIIYILLSFF